MESTLNGPEKNTCRHCITALTFLALTFLPSFAYATEAPFTDVTPTSWAYVQVNYLKEQGLLQGYSDGSFHPNSPISRAEALSMIMKAAAAGQAVSKQNAKKKSIDTQTIDKDNPVQISLPHGTKVIVQNLKTGEKTETDNIQNLTITVDSGTAAQLHLSKKNAEKPFKDVFQRNWFFEIVNEAKAKGIVDGLEDGTYFKPYDQISLAEALRILLKSAGIHTDNTDAPFPKGISANAWYAKDIAYAVQRTLLIQQEDGRIFPPSTLMNRGEMALLLYRFLKTQDNITFGYASWYGDGLAKTKLSTNAEYAQQHLTAANKTLPFGTIVRVTNMANGKYVDVVINDRGPYVTGRIIDLSRTAFGLIDNPGSGIISVHIEPRP